MNDNSDLSTTITVEKSAPDIYDAINNVRGWWSAGANGQTTNLHDEFLVDFKRHWWTFKIIETIPGQKVVWQCTGSYMPWNEDHHEWTGTTVQFEIVERDNQTGMRFTHKGLTPHCACFDGCLKGWTGYIQISLFNLLNDGVGTPDTAY